MKQMKISLIVLIGLCVVLTGCSVVQVEHNHAKLDKQARWVILPIKNYAQTPQAGQRSEAIVATLLRDRGLDMLARYPASKHDAGLPELNDDKRLADALNWAREKGFNYGVSGAVTEWDYKTGLDGEPAVGLTIEVINIKTGQVLWSGSASKAGWGRASLSGTAQKIIAKLIKRIPME